MLGYTQARPEPIRPAYGKDESWGERPDADSYVFRTFQNAKPYLLYPLTSRMKRLVSHFPMESVNTSPLKPHYNPSPVLSTSGLQCAVVVETASSPRAAAVAEAFGLQDGEGARTIQLFRSGELTIGSGETVLISGASGTGKTLLGRLLAGLPLSPQIQVLGEIKVSGERATAELGAGELPEVPIVDLFQLPLKDTIELLSRVGLSEARLYQHFPSTLSVGQLHRLRVAILAASPANSWLADDLGAALDDLTASIVAKGLRALANRSTSTLIVTSSAPARIQKALCPSIHLHIGLDGTIRTIQT
jgi:ABC-type ATPase with predicted acetyltransferase domain